MKYLGLILLFVLASYTGKAQEIPVVREPSDFIIQRIETIPSLSTLAPEIPNTGNFRIREVNFDTDFQRKEVNITALMQQEQQMKKRTVELAPPVQVPQLGRPSGHSEDNFSVSPRFFNQSFSPELQTRGTRNSVYRNAAETTGAHYLNSYNPFLRGRIYNPRYGPYYY